MKKALYYLLYASWHLLSHLPLSALYVLSNFIFFIVFRILRYRRRTVWISSSHGVGQSRHLFPRTRT